MSVEDRVAYWQRRARDAERQVVAVEREIASMQRWGERAYVESRFFAERCVFLAGLAVAHGAAFDALDDGKRLPS